MAKQSQVIGPRTHASASQYASWIRKIGTHTYRFKVMSRSDGEWSIRVDQSQGRGWSTVHCWIN